MTRMGIANRITEERYTKAKAELHTPRDDRRVMEKYGFGKATARKIRNTDSYYEYRSKSTTGKRYREHLSSILQDVESTNLDEFKLDFEKIQNGTVKPLVLTIIVLTGIMAFLLIGTIILMIGSK